MKYIHYLMIKEDLTKFMNRLESLKAKFDKSAISTLKSPGDFFKVATQYKAEDFKLQMDVIQMVLKDEHAQTDKPEIQKTKELLEWFLNAKQIKNKQQYFCDLKEDICDLAVTLTDIVLVEKKMQGQPPQVQLCG